MPSSGRSPVAEVWLSAGEAESNAANFLVAAEIDAFTASLTNDAFAFITGQLSGIDLNPNTLEAKQLIVLEFPIGKHLLLARVIDFGMQPTGQIA